MFGVEIPNDCFVNGVAIGFKVAGRYLSTQITELDREIFVLHLTTEQIKDVTVAFNAINLDFGFWIVCRYKEWETLDVIPVAVAKKHVRINCIDISSQ